MSLQKPVSEKRCGTRKKVFALSEGRSYRRYQKVQKKEGNKSGVFCQTQTGINQTSCVYEINTSTKHN